jgi:hypothetical protein
MLGFMLGFEVHEVRHLRALAPPVIMGELAPPLKHSHEEVRSAVQATSDAVVAGGPGGAMLRARAGISATATATLT